MVRISRTNLHLSKVVRLNQKEILYCCFLWLFSLVIFPRLDIWEDQAKSDDIVCSVSNGQFSFCIKFDRNYAVVTLLAILDREVVREFLDKIN